MSRIEKIVRALEDEQPDERYAGYKSISDLRNITVDEGKEMLIAAGRDFPLLFEGKIDSAERLIRSLANPPNAHEEYIPIILENIPRYSSRAKVESLRLLGWIKSREAAEAYMHIVRNYARTGELSRLPILQLKMIPPFYPEVFFPELFEYIDISNLETNIYSLCLDYFITRKISIGDLDHYAKRLINRYKELRDWLKPAQREDGVAWMWSAEYRTSRVPAVHLLTLFAFFRNPEIGALLPEALEYRDPFLKYRAIIASLFWKLVVDKRYFFDVARSAETRYRLYENLKQLRALELFPEEFNTLKAMAESHMVMWLYRVSEIRQVPDEIELMEVYSIGTETEAGDLALYLYRFRMQPPHQLAEMGWMAGTSGPYLAKDGPDAEYLGGLGGRTWTDLEPWDSMSPEEHVGDLDEIKAEWLKYYYKYKK